jgi:hypothetical protein
MHGRLLLLAGLAALALGSRTLPAQAPALSAADSAKLIQRGHQVYDSLKAGSFGQVHALFGPQMVAAVPTKEKLAELWAGIVAQTGALESLDKGEIHETAGVRAVVFSAKFANGTFSAIVAFALDGTIAGLGVRPSGS